MNKLYDNALKIQADMQRSNVEIQIYLNGWSPVCVRSCETNSPLLTKFAEQSLHLNGLF